MNTNTSYLKFDSASYPKFAVNLTTDNQDEDDDDEFTHQLLASGMKAIAFPLLCHHSNIDTNNCAHEILKAANKCQPVCSHFDEKRYLSTACATTAPLDGHSITCQQLLAPEYAFTEECMDFDDNEEDLKSASDAEFQLLGDYICQETDTKEDGCNAVIYGAILKCKQKCPKDDECTLKPFEDGGPNVTCSDLESTYERKKQTCRVAKTQTMNFLSYVAVASGNHISEQVRIKESD